MDNFSNTWTIIQLGGQLDKKNVHQSDIYNCPRMVQDPKSFYFFARKKF